MIKKLRNLEISIYPKTSKDSSDRKVKVMTLELCFLLLLVVAEDFMIVDTQEADVAEAAMVEVAEEQDVEEEEEEEEEAEEEVDAEDDMYPFD